MKLWPRRSRPEPPAPRPDPTRIAILEHDLYGIQPQPGTMAALAIGLRQTGTCLQHTPIDTSTLGDARPVGICQRCGRAMLLNENGDWVVAEARPENRS